MKCKGRNCKFDVDEPHLFGNCPDCEEPILPARLKAMPWATLCIECQGKRDQAKTGGARRKNLTDFAD